MGGRTVLVAVASVDQGRMPEPRGETEAADRGEMEAAMAGAGAILEAARSLVGRGGGELGKGCGQGQSTERRRAGAGGFRARAQGPAAAGVPTEEEKIRKKLSQRGVGKHVPADRARQDAAEGAALLDMAAEAARAVARRRAMMVGRGEAICWGRPLGGSENRISCAGLI